MRMIWGWEVEDVDENRGVHEDVYSCFVDTDYMDDEWEYGYYEDYYVISALLKMS